MANTNTNPYAAPDAPAPVTKKSGSALRRLDGFFVFAALCSFGALVGAFRLSSHVSYGLIPLFAVLIGVGFGRSRPQGYVITWVDRLFVALVAITALLPALIVPAFLSRSRVEFAVTVVVGCSPLVVAEVIHRWRIGTWWPTKHSDAQS